MQPRIITVTANTAIDNMLTLDRLVPGDNILASSLQQFACGKGLNVARALTILDCRVRTLGFVGEQNKALFDAFSLPGLATGFIPVKGHTRSNITLFEEQSGVETHIRTPGYRIEAEHCQQLQDSLARQLGRGDFLILSGSLPEGAPDGFYRELIAVAREKSAQVILDSSDEALALGVAGRPDLIAPNVPEFEALTGQRLASTQAIVREARLWVERGIGQVIVSCGEQGAIYVDADEALSASVDITSFDRPVSFVGCGDALLAGFVWAVSQGLGARAALSAGVSCGAANLFDREPGFFEKNRFLQLAKYVIIETL